MDTAKRTNKQRPYLYEVDLMRIIFISGVLLNHVTTAFSNAMPASISKTVLQATHLSLHFTRMGFMFMTGLVLFLNYYDKENSWLAFWKKRYSSVGFSYIAWNILLLLFTEGVAGTLFSKGNFFNELVDALIHGNHFYLYYVYVTFQLYLLFPLLVKLFKRFPKEHNIILLISFMLQLSLLFLIKYELPVVDTSNWWFFFRSYGMNFFVYQIYFIMGAYTAIHYQQVTSRIKKYQKWIGSLAVLLAIGTVGLYYFNRDILKLSAAKTMSIHQPYMLFYAISMVAAVFLIGLHYAKVRNKMAEQVTAKINLIAKVSFGLYLAQTIPLTILKMILSRLTFLPAWGFILLVPIGYLFVWLISFGIAYFCYKVPPFGRLIGRPQKRRYLVKEVFVHDKVNQ